MIQYENSSARSARTGEAVLVIIPAYNAAQHLVELIKRVRSFVCDENLLLVNDGSTDNTRNILDSLAVPHLAFSQNRGKGAALKAGFRYAIEKGYLSVLTLDADLQHLPEEIPRFYSQNDGRHLIIGTRTISRHTMPFDRWLTNNLTSIILSIFSTERVRDSQSGFRLLPVSLLKQLTLDTSGYDFESEILFKAGAIGYKIREVSISTVYGDSQSFINPFRDSLRFIRQIWRRIWA